MWEGPTKAPAAYLGVYLYKIRDNARKNIDDQTLKICAAPGYTQNQQRNREGRIWKEQVLFFQKCYIQSGKMIKWVSVLFFPLLLNGSKQQLNAFIVKFDTVSFFALFGKL